MDDLTIYIECLRKVMLEEIALGHGEKPITPAILFSMLDKAKYKLNRKQEKYQEMFDDKIGSHKSSGD